MGLRFQDHDPLQEVSSVKVPRPASPFITHETTLGVEMAVAVSRGNGKEDVVGEMR